MSVNPLKSRRARRFLTPVAIAAVGLVALSACSSGGSTPAASPSASLSALAQQLPASIIARGYINDLVQTPAAPFEFHDTTTNDLTGIDIELTKQLSTEIGFPLTIAETSDFANLIPGVQSGRADMIMSGTLDKKARQDVVDIVDYFKTGTVFMKLASNTAINSYADLCGKTVVTDSATDYPTQVAAISTQYCGGDATSIQILGSSSGFGDYVNQLNLGRAVAIVNGSDFSSYEASTDYKGQLAVVGDPIINPGVYGVLVNKDLTGLRDVIQKGLTAMIADGTYASILKKWGQDSAAVSTITVNSATK